MSYLWHYLLSRLLYDELIRHGGALAVLLVAACVALAAFWRSRRRAGRRPCDR